MSSSHYIVAMTSIMDTDEGFENLIKALHKIDEKVTKTNDCKALLYPYVEPNVALTAYEVENICGEELELENSVGRISKEYIYAYPPGIPIIAPGEEFTKAVVEKITNMMSMGVNMASDGDKLPFVTVCTIDTQSKMG